MNTFYTILQYTATLAIVVFAVIYVIRLAKSSFSSDTKKDNCGNNCGCK